MDKNRPITPDQRQQLLGVSKQVRLASEETMAWAVTLRRSLQNGDEEHSNAVLNAYEFVLLLQHDLSLLLSGLVQENTRLGTSMYARLLILALYESSKQMQKLLAKDFREQVVRVLDPDDDHRLKALHKRVSKIFDVSRQNFGVVRHGLAGHWTHDPEERQELIDHAEIQSVVDLVIEMLKLIQNLVNLFSTYFQTLGLFPPTYSSEGQST